MGKAEAVVENYLRDQAKAHDCLCFKFTPAGINGVPDRILIGYGKTVFVECKSDIGALRPQQKLRIRQMREAGAEVYVCNTRQLVDELFKTLQKKEKNTCT